MTGEDRHTVVSGGRRAVDAIGYSLSPRMRDDTHGEGGITLSLAVEQSRRDRAAWGCQ